MARFGRLLFTLASVLSLLLCVAAVGLGAWSYRVGRLARWETAGLQTPLRFVERRHVVGVSRGTFVYSLTTDTIEYTDPLLAADRLESRRVSTTQRLSFDVFVPTPPRLANHEVVDLKVLRYAELARDARSFERAVLVPFWAITLVSAVLPAWWFVRYRRRAVRRRRLAAGQCLRCGYDLRVQLTQGQSDRCPECGAPASAISVEANQPFPPSGVM